MTSERTPSSAFPPILAAPPCLFCARHPLNLRFIVGVINCPLVPHPLSYPSGQRAGASAYSSWWCAAHGCWSWRDDGREGVCRAFVVLDLGDRPAAAVRALVTVRLPLSSAFVCATSLATGLISRPVVLCRGRFLITAEHSDSDR